MRQNFFFFFHEIPAKSCFENLSIPFVHWCCNVELEKGSALLCLLMKAELGFQFFIDVRIVPLSLSNSIKGIKFRSWRAIGWAVNFSVGRYDKSKVPYLASFLSVLSTIIINIICHSTGYIRFAKNLMLHRLWKKIHVWYVKKMMILISTMSQPVFEEQLFQAAHDVPKTLFSFCNTFLFFSIYKNNWKM